MARQPKYAIIRDEIAAAIRGGDYAPGDRLPSETDLAERFSVSRPTVGRALQLLETAGLIDRRRGSGTFVRSAATGNGHLFGLLVPALGRTEIFDPICGHLGRALQSRGHALLWGDTAVAPGAGPDAAADAICREVREHDVTGVFFAPVELSSDMESVNQQVVDRLDADDIAVVLLDRDLVGYPGRSRYDLVGIDNRAAAYVITSHLLASGGPRIDVFARRGSAPTVPLRLLGCREALLAHGIAPEESWMHWGDPDSETDVSRLLAGGARTILCANDVTAGRLMGALRALGQRIPRDVRVAGFDDVRYASLLHPPLTTMRQPTKAIGAAAACAMLSRIDCPTLAPRDILLRAELVVRESCGSRAGGTADGDA